MKRRELLFGSSSIAAALLSGRIPTVQAEQPPVQQTVEIDTAIDLLPVPSELDVEYTRVTQIRIDSEDEEELPFQAQVVTEIDGIDVTDVETVVTASTDGDISFGAITGSFDQPKPGEKVEELDDWRIADNPDDERATASMDDMVAFATASEKETRIDGAKAGSKVQSGSYDAAVDEVDVLDEAFDHFGDMKQFFYIRSLAFGSPTITDNLQSFSAGFEESPRNFRGSDERLENKFLLEEADDVDLDDEEVKEILQELEQGEIVEYDAEHDDELVFVEVEIEAPPERNREAAPEANLSITASPSDGTATIEHQDGSSIPADSLELWVNGKLADTQPADEFDAFESGDSLPVDTGPLASVYLRWFDEDENEYYEYINQVVGNDAFETTYDPEAETVEITYTKESDVDSDLLELSHRKRIEADEETIRLETERLTKPLEKLGASLSNGDSLVVDDVEIRDRVLLDLDVPPKPPGGFGPNTTVVRYRVDKPTVTVRRRPEEGLVLNYYDSTARDADEFRVLADGEEMATQPADEYDTLEEGDRVQLSDVEFGTNIVVEWTVSDEPTVIEEHVVTPQLYVETSYDDTDGTLTITHSEGEAVDAANLELTLNGDTADTQFADEYETFSQGDTISVEAEPFASVGVHYTGADTVETFTRSVTGRDLFEGSYDISSETVTLTYTGEQEANTTNLTVRTYGRGTVSQNNPEPFADIDTLSNGDSVTIEDVGPKSWITVDVEIKQQRGDTATAFSTSVFRFSVTPRHAFEFEHSDGALVATYRDSVSRNAEEFRFLVDGTEADTQPGDKYDTLEEDDSIELGSFEPGTTILIEWPTSDDATEVQEYSVTPEATFNASYDKEDSILTITHDGGDDIEADNLDVYAPPATEGHTRWDGDGTVSEGDSMTIESDEKPERVIIVFDERKAIDRPELDN
jgi:hypothetical protein